MNVLTETLNNSLKAPIEIWIAAILTIMVYSYLLGDNPLYRLAEHLLVGSVIAYAVIVAIYSILIPRLVAPLLAGNWLYLIPLVLGFLLLAKIRPSWANLGNIPMGLLIGVGGALALSGALLGTIGPQVRDSLMSLKPTAYPGQNWFGVLNALIIVVGTIGTLLCFYFTAGDPNKKRSLGTGVLRLWGGAGRGFLMITFGAIFASLVVSRVSLFIGRVQFLLGDWLHIVKIP